MAKNDPKKIRENLERGRENLEQGINSSFLIDAPQPQRPVAVEELPVVEPDTVVAPEQTGMFARPSAADRIENIVQRTPMPMMPSLADRAERQAAVQRARQQADVQPSLADRAERAINVRLQQLLDPSERVKYSPAAVAQLNAELESAQKLREKEQQQIVEQEEEPLAAGMFSVDTGLNDFIAEQRAQQTVTQPPVESLKGQTDRMSFVLENYPTLMASADRAGLSDDEVRDMVNFTLAFDAARVIGNSISSERQAAILATMSKPMQALVVDIINAGIREDIDRGNIPQDYTARVAEAQQSGRDIVSDAMGGAGSPLSGVAEYVGGAVSKAIEQQQIIGEQSTGNTGQDVLRTAWNWSLGPLFDAWFAGAENVQRGVRAGALFTGTDLGQYSWTEAWNAAEKGQFSQERLSELREIYGQKPVDLVVEVMQAKNGNDPDFIGTLIQKYQDDPEMLDYLDKAINGVRNDQEFADLITSVRAAETGDLGSVVAQTKMELLFPGSGIDIAGAKPVGEYEQTESYSIQRNLTNVLGVFFLDPLLALGVVRGGVLSARYGMARVALEMNAPVKGTKVFQEPNVRNFLRTMGGQLQDLNRLEATDGVAAMAPVNASLRSMYKRFFTPEALDDMRIFLKSKNEADPAAALEEYFSNVENIQHIIVGQSARRGRQVQVPHMTAATARAKLVSLKLRGLTYPSVGAAQFLDNVFFEGFSASLPEQAGEDLARIISAEDGDKYVGRALGDFLIRDGEMVRTLTGRLVLDKLPKSWKVGQRYGWKRETGPKAFAERMRRLGAIWPDASRPLKVSDASDAERVERLVLAAGMPRHFSQIMREVWVASDEATRRMIGEGLARSYGYARGIDVVSDEGKRLIDEIGPGAGRGDQYSASMPNMVELEGRAAAIARERLGEGADKAAVRELSNDILKTELLPNATKYNPSMVNGRPGAITLSDMTEYMAFPDINRLEAFTARSSLLTALTGQNIGMSNATDIWVLGTLAGPRFQVRNAIEDMGLYIATAGSLRGYFKGRRFSTGRREATERPRKTEFAEPKGMKLGMFKTLSRGLGNQIGKLYADETAAIILPNLSKQDLIKANNLAREGNREALAKLVAKAYIRQRLRFLPGGRRIIGRTVDETKLTSDQLQELKWLEQAIEHGDVLHAMDEAAETGRHLADGFPARMDDMEDPGGLSAARNGDVIRVAGQDMKVHEYTVSYEDIPVYNGSNQSIKQWHHNIAKVLHGDGPKGQWTMQLLPRYYRAVRAGNETEVESIVKELAERVAGADESWGYGTRSMIQRASGFDGLARASLDNALQLFTTQNGRFNRPLFRQTQRKVVKEDGTEFTQYALWSLDETGERVNLVSQSDLAELAIKNVSPMYVNAPVTIKVTTPMNDRGQWTNRLWAAMGRSLARMTREPIFTANYLDSRSVLSPFEKKLIDVLGEEGAEKWAVNAATERAFRLTMNYVDNPNVRSQFAWQIRNVARFYRALEDFNRRMVRTTRNEPMAFAKIALAWNALDDSGFVWEDEFGEKYFVWPGSRQAFEAINGVFNMLSGGNVYSPSLPLAFTSRVNMVTPSADPNAWLPTFSGPYASMAILPIMRQLPGLRNLEEEFFGEYGKNRTIWDQALPAHVTRVMGFLSSQRGTTESRLNETDTVFASAARSAALAYAAAGLWEPDKFYTPEEIEKHRQRIDTTSQWIVGLKMVLSPVAFAALSVNVDTATDFAKTLGLDGMRPAFVQLLRKNEGDISAASIQWLKMNPDLSPFTIGTTESPDSKGYYGPFEETVRWIEDNQDIVEISSSGASYFAPTDGRQTLSAWSFLSASGLKSRKSTDTYIKEIMNAEGKAVYYNLRSQWIDQKRANVKDADGRWEAAKEELFATYPRLKTSLAGGLSTGSQSTIDEMVAEVDSMRKVGQALKDKGSLTDRGKDINRLIGLRDQIDSRLKKIDPRSPNEFKERERLRDTWKNVVEENLSLYPEDRQFRNVLYILSESLVENWGRYV